MLIALGPNSIEEKPRLLFSHNVVNLQRTKQSQQNKSSNSSYIKLEPWPQHHVDDGDTRTQVKGQ